MKDEVIVYGTSCTWWDSIDKTARSPLFSHLPVCPKCGCVLYQVDNLEKMIEGFTKKEKDGATGFLDFALWQRGKCATGLSQLVEQYKNETGNIVELNKE